MSKAKKFIKRELGEVLVDHRQIEIPYGTKNSMVMTKKQFYQLLDDFVYEETEGLRNGHHISINDYKAHNLKLIQLPRIKHYKLIPERVEEFNAFKFLNDTPWSGEEDFFKAHCVIKRLKNIGKLYDWFYPVFEDIEPPIEKGRLCLVKNVNDKDWVVKRYLENMWFEDVESKFEPEQWNYVKPLPKDFEL